MLELDEQADQQATKPSGRRRASATAAAAASTSQALDGPRPRAAGRRGKARAAALLEDRLQLMDVVEESGEAFLETIEEVNVAAAAKQQPAKAAKPKQSKQAKATTKASAAATKTTRTRRAAAAPAALSC